MSLLCASLTQEQTVKLIALIVLCAVCVLVLAIAIVLFVKSEKLNNEVRKLTAAAAKPEENEDCEEYEPVTETAESEPETVAEPAAEATVVAARSAPAPVEAAPQPQEEKPAAAKPKKSVAAAEVAATADDEDDEDDVLDAPVDVDVNGRDLPDYMKSIMSELSEPSRELLDSWVVRRRFSRMRDVWSYRGEKEFAADFFRNSIRFKTVMNEEIYALLFEKVRRSMRGDELSRLRLKYANAMYRYSKEGKPELIDVCVDVLKDDVKYHLDVLDERNKKVASVKKLAVIYTSSGRYKEALNLCNKAIARGLHDVGKRGFEPRREMLKELIAAEKAAEKAIEKD